MWYLDYEYASQLPKWDLYMMKLLRLKLHMSVMYEILLCETNKHA
jgi:hypothetical protein